MAQCRSCEAPIVWCATVNDKNIPMDEKPSDKGNMVIERGIARAATDEDRRLARPMFTSHFATCPDSYRHRRRK